MLSFYNYLDEINRKPKINDLTLITQIKDELNYYLDETKDVSPKPHQYTLEKRKVTKINLSGCVLKNLNQISYQLTNFEKLNELYLSKTQINDISALKDLNLTTLILTENNIQDISPLKNMRSLELLFLNNNKIQDISPLKDLKLLTRLYLDNNQIQDVSPLSNLNNLIYLRLYNNKNMKNIASLKNLKKLKEFIYKDPNFNDVYDLYEM